MDIRVKIDRAIIMEPLKRIIMEAGLFKEKQVRDKTRIRETFGAYITAGITVRDSRVTIVVY